MTATEAYTRLLSLGVPVLETADVAAALRVPTSNATHVLGRLARSGLVSRLRSGLWLVSRTPVDRYVIVDALTAPFPSYVSLQTALYLHGMIDQIPGVVYAISLARTHRIRTSIAVYSFHHIVPALFDGFETRSDGTKLASAEKALFDFVYLSSARSRIFARLPELELPAKFRRTLLRTWTARIGSPRRRSMVETRLSRIVQPEPRAAPRGSRTRR